MSYYLMIKPIFILSLINECSIITYDAKVVNIPISDVANIVHKFLKIVQIRILVSFDLKTNSIGLSLNFVLIYRC